MSYNLNVTSRWDFGLVTNACPHHRFPFLLSSACCHWAHMVWTLRVWKESDTQWVACTWLVSWDLHKEVPDACTICFSAFVLRASIRWKYFFRFHAFPTGIIMETEHVRQMRNVCTPRPTCHPGKISCVFCLSFPKGSYVGRTLNRVHPYNIKFLPKVPFLPSRVWTGIIMPSTVYLGDKECELSSTWAGGIYPRLKWQSFFIEVSTLSAII